MRKFSIIIPVYNVAPWLRECLDSVLAQTCTDWECICVDDGSTDGSGAILDEYCAADKCNSDDRCRLRVVHQGNAGVSAARNAALRIVSGDWVVFLDADDVMHPSMLAEMRTVIDATPDIDIIRVGSEQFADGSVPFSRYNECGGVSITDLSRQLPYADLAAMLWGAAYRRSVLPEGGFHAYCRGEDRLFVGEVLSKANRGARMVARLYGYRVRPGSSMNTPINAAKLHDRLGYSLDWLNVLCTCGKNADKRIYHEIGVNVTEGFATDMCAISDCDAQGLWHEWREFLQIISKFGCFSFWLQWVIRLNITLPYRFVVAITCRLPMKLKQKGFHR